MKKLIIAMQFAAVANFGVCLLVGLVANLSPSFFVDFAFGSNLGLNDQEIAFVHALWRFELL